MDEKRKAEIRATLLSLALSLGEPKERAERDLDAILPQAWEPLGQWLDALRAEARTALLMDAQVLAEAAEDAARLLELHAREDSVGHKCAANLRAALASLLGR